MTLWQGDGAIARGLVRQLYERVLAGEHPGLALRKLQLQAREQAHPRDWAPFTVSATWLPLGAPPAVIPSPP